MERKIKFTLPVKIAIVRAAAIRNKLSEKQAIKIVDCIRGRLAMNKRVPT